jgi:DNA modification methylase
VSTEEKVIKIKCEGKIYRELDDMIPLQGKLKSIDKENFDKLKRSLIKDGLPLGFHVWLDKDKTYICDGHHRIMAMKALRDEGYHIPSLPCTPVIAKDKKEAARAVLISNSRYAEMSQESLSDFMIDFELKFDDLEFLDLVDIDMKDISLEEPKQGLTDEDAVPEVAQNIHGVVLGDVYQLGEHRLICGDATKIEDVERLMNGQKADLLHTDPPYNVDYSNQDRPKAGKNNLGRIANDSMSDSDFKEFLTSALTCAFAVLKPDSSAYIWYASKESLNFINATELAGLEINQQVIWKKPMLLGRGKYQWAHEPCIFAIKGKPYFTDDRTKTTVWDFGGYDKSKNVHPTQKPVFIPEEALNNSSKEGSNVLDLFGGSGSTLIACEKTNRKCFMAELDPHYCSVIIERFQQFTGKKAVKLSP